MSATKLLLLASTKYLSTMVILMVNLREGESLPETDCQAELLLKFSPTIFNGIIAVPHANVRVYI